MKTRLLTYKHNLNFCCIFSNLTTKDSLSNSSLPNGNLQNSEMFFENTHGKPNLKRK